MVKKSACNAGDQCLIPGLERSPGGGNGNPLQYSCLGNPIDRGAWGCKELDTIEWLNMQFCVGTMWGLFSGFTKWYVELPWPGIEPKPPVVEAWSLNHRTTRKVPLCFCNTHTHTHGHWSVTSGENGWNPQGLKQRTLSDLGPAGLWQSSHSSISFSFGRVNKPHLKGKQIFWEGSVFGWRRTTYTNSWVILQILKSEGVKCSVMSDSLWPHGL